METKVVDLGTASKKIQGAVTGINDSLGGNPVTMQN
jgi:hypothetical protein